MKSSALDYDIVVICETWLNEHHNTSEVVDCNFYNVVRKDRCKVKTGCIRGGGVLIAVRTRFTVKILPLKYELPNTDIDQIIVVVTFAGNFEIILFVSYIPPNSPFEIYETHFKNCNYHLNNLKPYQYPIYVGDFNLGHLSWNNCNNLVPFHVNSNIDSLFFDFLCIQNLIQINNIYNENSRLLDLVLVDKELVSEVSSPVVPIFGNSVHHSPVIVDFSMCSYQPVLPDFEQNYDFHNADFASLNSYFNHIDWTSLSHESYLINMYSLFLKILYEGFSLFVPKKIIRSNRIPPWYNKRLTNLKNKKNKAYKRFREDKSNLDLKNIYSHCQNDFNTLNSFLYKSYILMTEISLKQNSKVFWTFVNSKRKSNGLPSYMFYCGNGSSEPTEICNLFADFFKSVYSSDCNMNNFHTDLEPLFDISNIELNCSDVEIALSELDIKTTLDNDGICNLLLKSCSNSLSYPLFLIFQTSLSTGKFLDCWKIAHVVPIHKSGCKQDISNYRPISKIQCIPKLLEKIVTIKIKPILNNIFCDNQHGFRIGRSTTTNLSLFCNYVYHNFDRKLQTDVIYTDFAKAFDKVNLTALCIKLEKLGFSSNFLQWITSYLSNRFQIVKINSNYSYQFHVTSGVPQGSHLGPLLFLLFINDLPKTIRFSQSLLFADDLKLFRSISNLSDCYLLQQDIDALADWCDANYLVLNIKKCQIFSLYRINSNITFNYKIRSVGLERVSLIKDLGIFLDRKLNFTDHIDFIISKAYSMLGFLKRNTAEFSDPFTLKALYNALVRPHLEYCCIIWNPIFSSHSIRIERVQKNFTRYVFFKLNWQIVKPSYTTRCALFDLSSLECRRKVYSVNFIRDLIHGHINCTALLERINFYAPIRSLRENFHFRNFLNSSKYAQKEPLTHCSEICNSVLIDCDIFNNISRISFKQQLFMALNHN